MDWTTNITNRTHWEEVRSADQAIRSVGLLRAVSECR